MILKNTELSQKNYLLLVSVLGFSVVTFVFVFFLSFYFFDKCKADNEEATVGGKNEEIIGAKQTDNVVVSTENADIASVIKKVSRHVFLPNGNVTVTTVLDPEGLRKTNPVFYQFVKEGDKVLIYPDRAILYNPAFDVVLDIAHLATPSAP